MAKKKIAKKQDQSPKEKPLNETRHPHRFGDSDEFKRLVADQAAAKTQEGSTRGVRGGGSKTVSSGDTSKPAPSFEMSVDMLAQIWQWPFMLWESKIGVPQLRLTELEALGIAKPSKVLIDYYMPELNPIYFAWGTLIAAVSTVLSSRLILLAEIRKAKQGTKPEPAGAPTRIKFPGEYKPQIV